MPLTIEKVFRFDAGHRCLGFTDCKEAALHGHTWTLRLVVEATRPLDSHKTIFDTNELARIVNPLIGSLDHAFLIWDQDPIRESLTTSCASVGIEDCLIVVDFNPTAEGLVEHLFQRVKAALPLENAILRRADLDVSATLRASYSE